MKRIILVLIALTSFTMAARMIISSSNIPTIVHIQDEDIVTFSEDGFYLNHSRDNADTSFEDTYYYGFHNSITFDTVGGDLGSLTLNPTGNSSDDVKVQLSDISSIKFTPVEEDTRDSDDDGISNYDEQYRYLTDPNKKDTDGDGVYDNEEIGRISSNVGRTWNPRIADLPECTMRMKSTPKIVYNYSSETGTSESVEIGTATEITTENSTTTGYQVSQGYELEVMVGLEHKVGADGGTTGKLEVTNHFSSETQHSTSSEYRQSYAENLSKTEAQAKTYNWTQDSATMEISVTLYNNSERSFTIENALFGLYGGGGPLSDGTLLKSIKSDLTTAVTLNPQDSIDVLLETGLKCEKAEQLILYSTSLQLFLDNATITGVDSETKREINFSKAIEDSRAVSAEINIDFGGALLSDGNERAGIHSQFAVYTKFNEDNIGDNIYGPVKLGEALTAMGVEYELDSDGSILSIDGVTRDTLNSKEWALLCQRVDPSNPNRDADIMLRSRANLDTITIAPREVYILTYEVDSDNDTLPDSIEKRYGTFDKATDDYDEDGISDFSEVAGWKHSEGSDTTTVWFTNPALEDSDNDGIPDSEDSDPITTLLYTENSVEKISFGTPHISSDTNWVNYSSADVSSLTITSKNIGESPLFRMKPNKPGIVNLLLNGSPLIVNEIEGNIGDPVYYETVLSAVSSLRENYTLTGAYYAEDGTFVDSINISFKSYLLAASTKATLENSQDSAWNTQEIAFDASPQMKFDVRTSGFLLWQAESSNSETLDLSKDSTALPSVGTIRNGWTLVKRDVVSGDIISGLTSGSSYIYKLVPYSQSDDNYCGYYTTLPASSAVRTKRIAITANFLGWKCHNENDGMGNAEIGVDYEVSQYHNGWSKILDKKKVWNDIDDGNTGGSWTTGTVYYQPEDSINIRFHLYEEDGGSGDGNDDDYNIKEDKIFRTSVRNLLVSNVPSQWGSGRMLTKIHSGNSVVGSRPSLLVGETRRLYYYERNTNDADMAWTLDLTWTLK